MRRLLSLIAVGALAATALVLSLPTVASSSTFPGSNAKVAVSSEADSQGNVNIYSVNPDGTGMTRLSTATVYETDPSWSADASKIVFAVDNLGASGDIGVMNADGSGRTIIYTDPNGCYTNNPSFTLDGTKIVFMLDGCGGNELWIMNVDGSGVTQVTHGQSETPVASYRRPQISPDGTKIGAVKSSSGGRSIVLMNLDGTGQTVAPATTTAYSVCFSPDAMKVTFDDGGGKIFVQNIDGTGTVQIPNPDFANTPDVAPCFSPDGTKVVFQRRGIGADSGIVTANADGTGSVSLVLAAVTLSDSPSWAAGPVSPTTTTTTTASDPSTPKFTG